MMKRLLAVLAVLGALLLALWLRPSDPASRAPLDATTPGPASSAFAHRHAAIPDRSALADALNSPQADIRADLRLVSTILDTFRTNFPHDGNPVGNNAEITAALTGKNKLRLSVIPPDHPAINRRGELCDRWGTPFFFHAESATEMAVRSAGPDRKMWTADDVVRSP